MTQEALKLALDFVETVHVGEWVGSIERQLEVITAVKEALAQTQEPVAHWSDCAVHSEPAYPKGECDCGGIVAVADYTALSDKYVALSDKYVALKAQRTWQRLTDEDISEIVRGTHNTGSFVRAIEAKLKEKNT
jgi:hypothetical protein